MNKWNRLLQALDDTLGFPNKVTSRVKKFRQGFDNKRNEHVIWIEYRVRVSNEHTPAHTAPVLEGHDQRSMKYLRELINDIETFEAID